MLQVVDGVALMDPQRYAMAWRNALVKAAKRMNAGLDGVVEYEHALVLHVLQDPSYLVNPFDLQNMALALAYAEEHDRPVAANHPVSYPLEGEQSRYGDSALVAVGLRLQTPFLMQYRHAVQADTAFGRRLLIKALPDIYRAQGAHAGPAQVIIDNSAAAVELLSNAQVH